MCTNVIVIIVVRTGIEPAMPNNGSVHSLPGIEPAPPPDSLSTLLDSNQLTLLIFGCCNIRRYKGQSVLPHNTKSEICSQDRIRTCVSIM